ncbi:hypothetical protein HN953_04125 [Candidatus Woesearchaeota archaeon]|jgi:hypothetical protein|nr:hypothetical protein [Candidatus Woesearchaeota archaeon]
MVKETNWVNIFFAILTILIVVYAISWFFGIRIPNLEQIELENAISEVPTTYNTGSNCEDIINNDPIYGGNSNRIYNDEETRNWILEIECRGVCPSNSYFHENTRISVRYKSHYCDDDGVLVCECSVHG